MRFKNTSGIDSQAIKEVIRFVQPSGVSRVHFRVTKARWAYRGFWSGRNVLIRVNAKAKYPMFYTPYQYGSQKGKKWWIANPLELVVVVAAHELRHAWQARSKSRRGYIWGGRGRFSEVDTEAYALRMLRAWRRRPTAHTATSSPPAQPVVPRERSSAAPAPRPCADTESIARPVLRPSPVPILAA
jgi:hypothetical protein